MQEKPENNGRIRIMEFQELAASKCRRRTGNREFIWSGLMYAAWWHAVTTVV